MVYLKKYYYWEKFMKSIHRNKYKFNGNYFGDTLLLCLNFIFKLFYIIRFQEFFLSFKEFKLDNSKFFNNIKN